MIREIKGKWYALAKDVEGTEYLHGPFSRQDNATRWFKSQIVVEVKVVKPIDQETLQQFYLLYGQDAPYKVNEDGTISYNGD